MSYPEKRREVLEQTMRNEVFQVARAVLADEGMEALTMDRIAREIGVSRGTVYNYFADASAVVAFVEARLFEPVHDRVLAIVGGDLGPEVKLRTILLVLLDALFESRALALATFARRELKGPRAEQNVKMRRELLALFRDVLTEGATRGTFRAELVDTGAEILLNTFAGVATGMLFSGEFQPGDRLVPGLMNVLLLGLKPRDSGEARNARPVNVQP